MSYSLIPDNVATKKKQPAVSGQPATTGAMQPPYNQISYLQDNNNSQLIPLSPDAIKQGSNQVVQTANQAVVQQPNPVNDPTYKLTQQKTQDLLNNPSQGFNPQAYKTNAMDQFNRGQSEAMEATRQMLADTSQSGELKSEFMKNAILGSRERADYRTGLDTQLSQKKIDDLLAATSAGMAATETGSNAFSNYINSLATTRGMYEPEAQRSADIQSQVLGQQHETGERVSTQSWNTGERLGEQDFTTIQNSLDRELNEAIANQDDARIREIQSDQNVLALKMQTNDMTHDESMAWLTSELENAKADNDVEREKTLISYKAIEQMRVDEREFGYEEALTNLQGDINREIAAGNNENAIALQKSELEYRTNRDIEEFANERVALELEKIGVDMQVVEDQYNQMLTAYGEDAANEFLGATLATHGVDTSGFDIVSTKDKINNALKEEFQSIQDQFAMSHGNNTEMVQDGTLTPAGIKKFNEYYNFTMYGELTAEQKEERRTAGYLDETDVPTAQAGDKFKISDPYQVSNLDTMPDGSTINGQLIPEGEYTAVVKTESKGSRVFGTLRDYELTYLADTEGNEYLVNINKGGAKGNIISNFWAN